MVETDTPFPPPQHPLRSWPAITAFAGWWVLLAVLFAVQLRMAAAFRGGERSWTEALAIGALDSFSWGAVAVVVLWMAGRVRPAAIGWARFIAIHVAVAATIMPARLWAMGHLADLVRESASTVTWFSRIIVATPTNVLAYVLLTGAAYTIHFVLGYRKRELEAAQLEARLAGAELEVLKLQLQPAFLARGLESIVVLMHRDIGAADRGLALLGDILRLTLQRAQRQTVSLQEEVELLEVYLALRTAELGERLLVDWDCEPEAMDAEVPSLLLQPLADRLIGSDLESGGEPLRLMIATRRKDGRIEISIQSGDSSFISSPPTEQADDGLAAVGKRLQQLYGAGEFLYLVERHENGVHVTLQLPMREAPASTANTLVTSATDLQRPAEAVVR